LSLKLTDVIPAQRQLFIDSLPYTCPRKFQAADLSRPSLLLAAAGAEE